MATFKSVVVDPPESKDGSAASTPAAPADGASTENNPALPGSEVQRIPNDESAEDMTGDFLDKLLTIRVGSNGNYILDIDPSIINDDVVKKFWKENATPVGAPVYLSLVDRFMNFLKAIINAIVKFVFGKENFWAQKGNKSIELQASTLEGADGMKQLLIAQIKDQSSILKDRLGFIGKNGDAITEESVSKAIEERTREISNDSKTMDFAQADVESLGFFVESYDEQLRRKEAADDALSSELMKSPKIVVALAAAYPAVFAGQGKAVEKALESFATGKDYKPSAATAAQLNKLVSGAYQLHEHALINGKPILNVSQSLRESGSLGISNALAKRQMLSIFDAKYSATNLESAIKRSAELKDAVPAEMQTKIAALKAKASVPHFLSSEQDARWFERRKLDVANGIKPEQQRDKPVIAAPAIAVEPVVKKTLHRPADSHRELFDEALTHEDPIKYVLGLSMEKQQDFFSAIGKESRLTRGTSAGVDPWLLSQSGETGNVSIEDINEQMQEFRDAHAGPKGVDANPMVKRSEYEYLCYYAGLAMYEQHKMGDREDYSARYQENLKDAGPNDKSYKEAMTFRG